jgi:hypothetical protein
MTIKHGNKIATTPFFNPCGVMKEQRVCQVVAGGGYGHHDLQILYGIPQRLSGLCQYGVMCKKCPSLFAVLYAYLPKKTRETRHSWDISYTTLLR